MPLVLVLIWISSFSTIFVCYILLSSIKSFISCALCLGVQSFVWMPFISFMLHSYGISFAASTFRMAILTASFTLHRRRSQVFSDLLIKRCVVSTFAEKEIHSNNILIYAFISSNYCMVFAYIPLVANASAHMLFLETDYSAAESSSTIQLRSSKYAFLHTHFIVSYTFETVATRYTINRFLLECVAAQSQTHLSNALEIFS